MSGDRPPAWVRAAWPEGSPSATRAPWGFDHETWLLTGDGRRLVVQRRSDTSDPTEPGPRSIRAAVRLAGMPVPEPTLVGRDGGHPILTLPYIEGRPGSELLADAAGAMVVGRACGQVSARLSAIATGTLPLPGTWASGEALRVAGAAWLRRSADLLDDRTAARLGELLGVAARETDRVPAVFAHGDLAPVNVLVRGRDVAAVLDLDRACLAHPLFDAAWFAWVVGHHHPDVAPVAWRAFAAGTGLPDGETGAFAWLQPLQLLERCATSGAAADRAKWAIRLTAALEDGAVG